MQDRIVPTAPSLRLMLSEKERAARLAYWLRDVRLRQGLTPSELAEQIAQRWPALRFRLAQSVEPQLSAEESWAGVPARQLQQQVERWRVRLQPVGVTGIDWQDWTHYPH